MLKIVVILYFCVQIACMIYVSFLSIEFLMIATENVFLSSIYRVQASWEFLN